MMKSSIFSRIFIFLLMILPVVSCNKGNHSIHNGNLVIDFDKHMKSKVTAANLSSNPLMKDFAASEYIVGNETEIKDFRLTSSTTTRKSTPEGMATLYTLKGEYRQKEVFIEKTTEITVPDSIKDIAIFRVSYVNRGQEPMEVQKWVNNAYNIESAGDTPNFWSFQASSSSERKDWILPVNPGFKKKNFMGMNNSDYGGGIPLIDIWRKNGGLAVGHTELVPRLVSLPVSMKKGDTEASMAVEYNFETPFILKESDTLKTYNTVVMTHEGDYFSSLQKYSRLMQYLGIRFAPSEDEAFEAVWCSWGYMRKFTMEEVLGTLPKVKELGIKWVDIDDGYQKAEGDWDVDRSRFAEGNPAMRKLTDRIHAYGMKAKLWWAPLAADPGSDLLKQHPDLILQNEEGVPRYITWWDSYLLSPAYKGTREHTLKMVHMFINDWGFDGLKMDGQHLNCVPPDYNPAHKLDYPEQSCEQLPGFFKMIYDTARAIKPYAVVQNCPCGDAVSFYNIPYMNQAVASDPTSSRQIRQKGKTYKAIYPGIAYYGDHVELSDGGDDFATQIGLGAVLGTKFTWPKDNPFVTEGHFVLTPEKERVWKQWIDIYKSKMLSKANYLGSLYDIGYDKPETHVIQKGDTLFYAFYDSTWTGKIELKGLKSQSYEVNDYVNRKHLGYVDKTNPVMDVSFKNNLLIEVYPVKK